MSELSVLIITSGISELIGLLMACWAFIVLSFAPQGKFRQLPVFALFLLIEIDWVAVWFISLFFVGNGFTSNLAIGSAFAVLFLGMSLPLSWIIFARVAIARQTIRPLVLSFQRL